MLIITDLDGTLTDERHRHQLILLSKEIEFYELSHLDKINQHGLDLIEELKIKNKAKDHILVVLTARPKTYNKDDEAVDYRKETKNWLKSNQITYDELNMRSSSVESDMIIEDKIKRFKDIVIQHLDEREIYFLENDNKIAKRAKEECPRTHVYLVSYVGYHEIV